MSFKLEININLPFPHYDPTHNSKFILMLVHHGSVLSISNVQSFARTSHGELLPWCHVEQSCCWVEKQKKTVAGTTVVWVTIEMFIYIDGFGQLEPGKRIIISQEGRKHSGREGTSRFDCRMVVLEIWKIIWAIIRLSAFYNMLGKHCLLLLYNECININISILYRFAPYKAGIMVFRRIAE